MIHVTVWNEFKHEKESEVVAKIYPNGIHQAIADFLKCDDIDVRTATLDMPDCGLTQDVLDHTRPDEQPAYSTEWPIEGDARISRLNELARAEIDNTYELLRLMDGEPGAFFPIVADDAHEDAFLLSAQLPRQLVQKAQIMLAHMRDVDKIYESKNK